MDVDTAENQIQSTVVVWIAIGDDFYGVISEEEQ